MEIGNAASSAGGEDGAVPRSVGRVGRAPLCRVSVVATGRRLVLATYICWGRSEPGIDGQMVDLLLHVAQLCMQDDTASGRTRVGMLFWFAGKEFDCGLKVK